jgi:probable F420-dependent oxidoreductase
VVVAPAAPPTSEFGIAIPQVLLERRVDTERLERFLRRVEELRFGSGWVLEQMIGVAPTLEPITLLSYVAAVTRSLRLGVAVVVSTLRVPVELAKALATLDQLSGGRLIAGVALGGGVDKYPAFGLSPERRVRRFTEGVELLKRLWTEPSVTFDGEFWRLEDATVEPKPVQQPRPPIWFGSGNPRGLRRSVQLGDGWIGAGSSSTEEFRGNVSLVRSDLAETGRDESSFAIAKRVYFAVDDDRERARTRLREWFALFYRDADLADRVAVFGAVDQCVAGLRDVREAGARTIIVNPVFDFEEQLEVLARDVVPHVAAAAPSPR